VCAKLVHMCAWPHWNTTHGWIICAAILDPMGWLRLVSSLKLYVSFDKETYNFKEPTNRSHPICVPRLTSICVMTHACESHDADVCEPYVWNDSFQFVSTHSYVCHGCMPVWGLIHMCDMTLSCVMTHSCVSWRMHTCECANDIVQIKF